MVYGACYLKGTRFFDRGGMIAGPSPRSDRCFYWDSSLRALPYLSNKEFRLGPGKRWQNRKEGVHVAAAPAPFLVNGAASSASTRKERIHFR